VLKAHGFPGDKRLGAGVVDGRSVWADGDAPAALLAAIVSQVRMLPSVRPGWVDKFAVWQHGSKPAVRDPLYEVCNLAHCFACSSAAALCWSEWCPRDLP